jgi:hypothetical protein
MPMGETRNNFLESTRQFWQSRTERQLTIEDARQIAENVVGYFRLLLEWQAAERRPPSELPQEGCRQ